MGIILSRLSPVSFGIDRFRGHHPQPKGNQVIRRRPVMARLNKEEKEILEAYEGDKVKTVHGKKG